jgi:hypothetical protein
MKRREVISLLGGAAAGPLVGAGEAFSMPVIGVGNSSPAGLTPVKGGTSTGPSSPRVTLRQILDWCPEPRGVMPKGSHAPIPTMTGENAEGAGEADVNRQMGDRIAQVLHEMKVNDDPSDPNAGPRFVIQWRMFPNAANKQVQAGQCGCGCSCGCG